MFSVFNTFKFVHEVALQRKTNNDKSTEIFPPLLLIYALVHCRESRKVSKRFQLSRRREGFALLGVITLWPIWSALDPPGCHGTLLTPGVPILYLYDLPLTPLGLMAPCWPLVSLFYTYMICAWPSWVSWRPVDPWCPYSIPVGSALDPPGCHGALLTPGVPTLYLYDLRLTLLGVMAPCWPLVSPVTSVCRSVSLSSVLGLLHSKNITLEIKRTRTLTTSYAFKKIII